MSNIVEHADGYEYPHWALVMFRNMSNNKVTFGWLPLEDHEWIEDVSSPFDYPSVIHWITPYPCVPTVLACITGDEPEGLHVDVEELNRAPYHTEGD